MDEQLYQAVCENDHQKSSDLELGDIAEDFCSKCGEQYMYDCENCHKPIKGKYLVEVLSRSEKLRSQTTVIVVE